MTAPTHIALAVVVCKFAGIPSNMLPFAVGGALIPDLDHPHSALGRLFFFISGPLNQAFGHRTLTHSIFLYLIPLIVGFFWCKILFWVVIGAITHIVIDALNTSGVQMLWPYSKKAVVIGNEGWRFPTASKQEFIMLFILGSLAWANSRIGTMGGYRALVGLMTGSYDIAKIQYYNAGLKEYYLEGSWREKGGQIIKKRYEVVGEQGKNITLWDGDKLVGIPDDVEPMRINGKEGARVWNVIKICGWVKLRDGHGFYWDGKRWLEAKSGDVVYGTFKTKEKVEFENLDFD